MVILYQIIRTQVLQFQTLKFWKWPAIWILYIQSMKERHMHDVQSMCNQTMQKKCQKCEVATCTRASVQSVKCNFWLDQVVALGFYCLIMWFSTHLDQFSGVKCQILCKINSSIFFPSNFQFLCSSHIKVMTNSKTRHSQMMYRWGAGGPSLGQFWAVATYTRVSVQKLKIWILQKLTGASFRACF